jgi:hypothetical protein
MAGQKSGTVPFLYTPGSLVALTPAGMHAMCEQPAYLPGWLGRALDLLILTHDYLSLYLFFDSHLAILLVFYLLLCLQVMKKRRILIYYLFIVILLLISIQSIVKTIYYAWESIKPKFPLFQIFIKFNCIIQIPYSN